MEQNLTCFKCHKDTATLTYEENRIYKVSCPCGCEYSFEHSSMKCAKEYHCKMIELFAAFDKIDQPNQPNQLKQENKQLKELLQLAADDMSSIADSIANTHKLLADSEGEVCNLKLGRCDVCNKNCQYDTDGNDGCNFKWKHANELNNW